MPNPSEKMLEHTKIPGISTAIVSDGKVVPHAAGVTNIQNPQPVTDTTVFEAASLSKPVFAYIVLKMVEDGKFSRPGEKPEDGFDRPLHEICDFGPPHLRDHPNYKLLTVRMILSHQTGLPNWFPKDSKEPPEVSQQYIANVKAGTAFNYSGEAYFFLNDVLERVSGQKFHQLSQSFFHSKDLQMTHSSFIPHADNSPEGNNRAWGHRMDQSVDESLHCAPRDENEPKPIPASSLYTTAEDYGKFLNACMSDSFISQHMFGYQIALRGKDAKASNAGVTDDTLSHLHWGLGIGIQTNPDGSKIAFHWGDNVTFRGFAAMDLQTKKGVVCLTNSQNGPLMFRQVAEPVVGNLTPVSQWLTHREQLNLNTTDMYRRVIVVEKKSNVGESISSEVDDSPPATPST